MGHKYQINLSSDLIVKTLVRKFLASKYQISNFIQKKLKNPKNPLKKHKWSVVDVTKNEFKKNCYNHRNF